jgi:hypothetical protein
MKTNLREVIDPPPRVEYEQGAGVFTNMDHSQHHSPRGWCDNLQAFGGLCRIWREYTSLIFVGSVVTMLYHQGLALTIIITQPLSLEAFSSSFTTIAANAASRRRPSSFYTFSRQHDLPRSNKDARGTNNNMSLYIDADAGDITVPVDDISLNGDDQSSIVEVAKLEYDSPPENGQGTIVNVNDDSSSSSPPTTIKPKSSTPPFPIVLWRFTRPHTIIGSAIAIPSIFLLAAPTYQSFFTIRSLASLLYAVIPALFMNLYITGLNQMTDVEIDKINVSAA